MNEILEWPIADPWVALAARPALEAWYLDRTATCEHHPQPHPGTFALCDDRIYCATCTTRKLGEHLLTGALLHDRRCYTCPAPAATICFTRPEPRSPGYHLLLGACAAHRPATARIFASRSDAA